MSGILYEVEGRTAIITLNRPEKRNSYTEEMVDGFVRRLSEIHERQ